MAQSTLHFSIGMLLASALTLKPVILALKQRIPASPSIARWCCASYALGLYATLPAIIRRLTQNPELGQSAWWNLFIAYPLIGKLPLPSLALGELLMGILLAAQYATILLAIHRLNKNHPNSPEVT